MEKYYPQIGEHLYLSKSTGSYYIDLVKTPYTVIGVNNSHIIIQEAKCIYYGDRYYDTRADEIVPDSSGEVLTLNWAPKKCRWQVDKHKTGYPSIAHFGEGYKECPYLD